MTSKYLTRSNFLDSAYGPLISSPWLTGPPSTSREEETFADLRKAVDVLYTTPGTNRDYGSAVERSLRIYNCQSLSEIPLDLRTFEKRYPLNGFTPTLGFKSEGAYRAWRKKVRAVMRRYFGVIEAASTRKTIVDDWAPLLDETLDLAIQVGLPQQKMIPFNILIDEARARCLSPETLTFSEIESISNDLNDGRKSSFRQVGRLLLSLTDTPNVSAELLNITNACQTRHSELFAVPTKLIHEATQLIDDHCLGDYDEISESQEGARSDNTRKTYMSCIKSYLVRAAGLGLLNDIESLSIALAPDVFHPTLRAWHRNRKDDFEVGRRSMAYYVRRLMFFANLLGICSEHIAKALKTNRELVIGKGMAEVMSPAAQAFCAFLLSSKRNSLQFQSLHIRFYNLVKDLIDQEQSRSLSKKEQDRLRQLGTLAAMSAIWLWFCPLRIDNMINLRIGRTDPWLFMPGQHGDYARILIPGDRTKTNKPIDHKLYRNKSRALEIIEWYIQNVRPRYGSFAESPFLFPGLGHGQNPISGGSVRVWLSTHCRSIGYYPIKPHWFRHGVASLFLQKNRGAYTHIGRLLDDKPDTVRLYYGFVDDERLRGEAQVEWLSLADFPMEDFEKGPGDRR